jgi:hypothetical protein
MGIKKSVMLSDHTVAYIDARRKHDGEEVDGDKPSLKWSAPVNAGFAELSWLTRQLCPELSIKAWHLLLDTYAGHFFDDLMPVHSPFRLASDILDHYGEISIEAFEKEEAEAIKSIHALSQPQQYAASQVIRIFWSQNWDGSLSEIIEKIKTML